MPVSYQTFLIYYVLACNSFGRIWGPMKLTVRQPRSVWTKLSHVAPFLFLPVGLKRDSAIIFLNAVQQVCLKICYAINMQHKVFIALFVPFSLTMWGCPQHALSSFNLLLSAHACVHACTHKHPYLHNHTQRGVPGVGHNYCVYRCLLIMSDRPHNFCSPAVSCALPPTSTPL